jgi:hypothetical protein
VPAPGWFKKYSHVVAVAKGCRHHGNHRCWFFCTGQEQIVLDDALKIVARGEDKEDRAAATRVAC